VLLPAQDNLGYFLAWFQSLQLPSTQSGSPLAPNPMCFLKYVLICEQNCSLSTSISIRIPLHQHKL
jgi:hypothetical protein